MLEEDVIFVEDAQDDYSCFEEIVETAAGPSDFDRRSIKKKKKNIIEDANLQKLLDVCEFYVRVQTELCNDVGKKFDIGLIELNITGLNVDLMTLKEFWLYISYIPNHSFLYIENGGSVKYFCVDGCLDCELYSGLSCKCFSLQFVERNNNSLCIKVLLLESLCREAVSLNETRSRNSVLGHFFDLDLSVPEDMSSTELIDLETLYSSVKRLHNDNISNNIQHPLLIPELRPYQQRAVAWMLQKETTSNEVDMVPNFFVKIVAKGNELLYYNKYEGYIVLSEPMSKTFPKGGILADEMGLGKTVEVLALILLNPGVNIMVPKDQSAEKCAQIVDPSSCSRIVEDEDKESDNSFSEGNIVVRQNLKQSSKRTTHDSTKINRNRRKRKSSSVEILPTKSKSKGETYEILQKWYNQMLSETSRKSAHSQRDTSLIPGLRCVCGEERKRLSRIQCCGCSNWQHLKCMGSPNNEGYNCPSCWQKREPVNSGTTLIVSPASISNQWLIETQKHIKPDNFKVLVYRGVQKDGFVQPQYIASHQLVLTTYEILRKELVHADINSSEKPRALRYSKRFYAVSSPLVLVNWWRICLDEAQMVEHPTSKTAEMACRLNSEHRWAISGTPIQKTVQDLFGLIQFLGVEPYSCLRYWTYCLCIPYYQRNLEPMHKLLNLIMWRTRKKDILHEINIPEQSHEFHWLNFTPVEEHFYRLQHTTCSNNFILICSKFGEINVPLKALNRNILHKLLQPLLRLRQACSHHHVVRGFHVSQKATMTMDELLDSLLKKTKLEAEEALRHTIAAINGLAGIHIIKELWTEAVECYREVLRLSEQYKDSLKTDTLQRIHTLHNLAEILASNSEGIPPTLRDHELKQQATELEDKFMKKQEAQVNAANEALTALINHVNELLSSFSVGRDEWWSDMVMWLMTNDEKGEFLSRIHHELLENQVPGQTSIINRIKTLPTIEHQLAVWCDTLFENRDKALEKLQLLTKMNLLDLANAAVDCHLRTNNINATKKKKCHLCTHEAFLKQYESHLFAVNSKQTQHSFVGEVLIMNNLNQGTWKASEQERIIRVLLAFGRTRRASSELIDDGNNFLKVLEGMKKEFKQLRYTWTQIRDRVSVQDELHMAKLRLRVRFEDEPAPVPKNNRKENPLHHLSSIVANKLETIHVIESHEIEAHASRFQSDRIQSEVELRRKMGQLQYLKNLEKNQGCKTNTEPCPICQAELGGKWSVLQCGHCFCVECIQCLMQTIGLRTFNVKCPVCRDVTHSSDISFVDIGAKYQVEDKWPDTTVCGSFSTKIEAVIRCLMSIRKTEPGVKALVFSTWEKVLDVLERALRMNDILFSRLQSGSKYKESLQLFKEGSRQVTALLIPVHLGAKGLNLTEATHVLLVDPMLNLADELQAVGRVHRFGQTKKTTVHHFFIRGTIEERIYEATHFSADKWSDNSFTVQQLRELFNCTNEMQRNVDSQNVLNTS